MVDLFESHLRKENLGGFSKLLVLLLLPVLPAVASVFLHPNAPTFTADYDNSSLVSLETVESWETSILWIDARSEDDFSTDHIPTAINLPPDQFDEHLPYLLNRWKQELAIVVYCDNAGCGVSEQVADRLRGEMQMDNVFILKGGWKAWQNR